MSKKSFTIYFFPNFGSVGLITRRALIPILTLEEDVEDEDFSEEECSDSQLVHKVFESDEKNHMFLHDLVPSAFEHRLLLKTEFQNGKTGVFLYLIKFMCESFRVHRECLQSSKNALKEYTKKFYFDNSNDEIEEN